MQLTAVLIPLWIIFSVKASSSHDHHRWLRTEVMDGNGLYILDWKIVEKEIVFRVTVNTRGFIGLGFSLKSSKMSDADLVLAWVDDRTGKPTVLNHTMFSGDVIIKNEPIKTEEIDFVTDELFLHNVVIKSERDDYPHSSDFTYSNNDLTKPKTIICSESEYIAEGNFPFDLIIVKEEPKLNISNDSTTILEDDSSMLLGKNFECYICRHVAFRVTDLRKHIRKNHVVDSNSLVRRQDRKQRLRQRETPHFGEKRYRCDHDQCYRTFASRSNLHCHKSRHRQKTIACDQCDRKFLNQSTLKQHKVIHSGIKPFACSECEQKFSDSSTLYKHKQTHSNERPFACHLCNQRCSRKSTLQRHLGTHTGTKSFVCSICQKKFSRNSTLNHHKLLHIGQFPFECEKCNRKFVTKSTLNHHLQTHTNGPRSRCFKCDECMRSYATKVRLNEHKETHVVERTKYSTDQRATQIHHGNLSHVFTGGKSDVKMNVNSRKKKKLSKQTILLNKCKSLRKV